MSMLTTVQRFCGRTNLSVPSTVYGTTDPQIRQILALLEEEGDDLSKRGDWNELTFEALHTTTAAEDQGAITTIASNGFNYIKNGTIWDRNLRLPVYVIDGPNWQAAKAMSLTGPRYQARIRGGKLISNPVPTAGHTWAFEYISKNWILGIDGTTYKQYFTLDTDTILLPESIVLMGLRWRFKKEKGLEYAEDFRTYESQVMDALSRNGMKRTLNMGNPAPMVSPGVVVPLGSWITP
jgi:hypothetical protein